MKFSMTVKHAGTEGPSWIETYDRPEIETEEAAKEYCIAAVTFFNATLRPHERPREYIGYTIIGDSEVHLWEKTNMMTLQDPNGGLYDTGTCVRCGITGRRYSLSGEFHRDHEFRARKYEVCKPESEDK